MPKLLQPVGKAQANQPADARLVQQLLNRFRPAGAALLRIDGVVSQDVVSAIEDFQRRIAHVLHPDGVVDPAGGTFKALCGGNTDVFNVAWGAKVSAAFKQKTIAICDALAIPVDFLMSSMAFESGETFSPSVKNAAGSGAVGLIQFMPATAIDLGTTTDLLSMMSAEAQLDFVQRFFASKKGKLQSLEDVYMRILYPAAIGRPAAAVLFTSPSVTYQQNQGLDVDHDGKITIAEAAAKVRAKFEKGIRAGFIG